jgi:hypothetical protein
MSSPVEVPCKVTFTPISSPKLMESPIVGVVTNKLINLLTKSHKKSGERSRKMRHTKNNNKHRKTSLGETFRKE